MHLASPSRNTRSEYLNGLWRINGNKNTLCRESYRLVHDSGQSILITLKPLIIAGLKHVTIQSEGMGRFALEEWRKAGLATGQVTLAVLSMEDKVPEYILPLFGFMV